MIGKRLNILATKLAFQARYYSSLSQIKPRDCGFSSSTKEPHPINPALARSWISRLNPKTPVSMLSIPGTHDSATYNPNSMRQFALSSQCQTWTVGQQLRAGIRYLDLRVKLTPDGRLLTFHGPAQYHQLYEILEDISIFLRENPNEFIIAAFQSEAAPDPSDKILESFKKYDIPCHLSPAIPTVQELRGKVWVYSGYWIPFCNQTFHLEGACMAGQTQNYYLQNLYKITDKFNVNAKWIAAYTAAFDILNREDKMKINFLSAAGSLDDPSNPVEAIKGVLNLVKWWPRHVAFDNEGPNACMLNQLRIDQNRKKITGVSIMDFPGDQLIDAIINSNDL